MVFQKAAAVFSFLFLSATIGFGQQPANLLSPDQLDTLVAPIALYPDPLLSQVLAASTYPLEIVEAQQWLNQNSNLQGAQLVDAAKQQNWDPSVQALVAFPDAMNLLGRDIRWTTDLGNAFLSQQADVMGAVQRMRARASANGRLATTPQQVVTTEMQDGQSAIEIQPANPQVMYVPVYQPSYVWGPPAWDAYADLWYGGGFGFGWGPGIYIGSYYPGWGGWGGWGWGAGWFGGRGLYVNSGFFNRYGFRGGSYGRFGGGFGGGRGAWAHDPGHRLSVPYPSRTVASRFNSTRFNSGFAGGGRSGFNGGGAGRSFNGRSNAGQFNSGRFNSVGAQQNRGANGGAWRTFGSGSGTSQANSGRFNSGSTAGAYRGFNSGGRPAQATPNYSSRGGSQSYRGANQAATSYRSAPSVNQSYGRSFSAPRQSYSAPRQSFSAPRQSFSAPRQNFSAPRQSSPSPRSFSGGGGGHSGGHASSGGGGGHSSGGGSHGSGGGGHRR